MRFEELQSIWETQTHRPVFAFNDFGLHMALYQSRDQARRRLFWGNYFPFFICVLLGFLALLATCGAFYFKDSVDDFPMNSWDGLAFFVAATFFVVAASSMYASRRRHEKNQNVFAPSLRQEIERGIAQVEFEMDTAASPQVWRNIVLCFLAALLTCWEMGRLNGNPAPWGTIGLVALCMFVTLVAIVPAARQTKEGTLVPRRRALETLRAKLDEAATES